MLPTLLCVFLVAPPVQPSLTGSWVVVDDFNGDSKPDLAFANQIGNSVSILLNNSK